MTNLLKKLFADNQQTRLENQPLRNDLWNLERQVGQIASEKATRPGEALLETLEKKSTT